MVEEAVISISMELEKSQPMVVCRSITKTTESINYLDGQVLA